MYSFMVTNMVAMVKLFALISGSFDIFWYQCLIGCRWHCWSAATVWRLNRVRIGGGGSGSLTCRRGCRGAHRSHQCRCGCPCYPHRHWAAQGHLVRKTNKYFDINQEHFFESGKFLLTHGFKHCLHFWWPLLHEQVEVWHWLTVVHRWRRFWSVDRC